RSFSATWQVPANQAHGTYTVQVGTFRADWGINYTWESYAAYITVGAPGATATPTPTRTATPTRTDTPTATVPPDCTVRPKVSLTTRSLGGGQLEATLQAQSQAGVPNNSLERITFTSVTNGTVRVNGSPATVGVAVPLSFAQSATFVLTRLQAGQPSTATFLVRDRCGDWQTLVGGGPSAF
ncbi:MAG: hypothetical protein AB7K36_27445, partial [Chloroflexota bacterium]